MTGPAHACWSTVIHLTKTQVITRNEHGNVSREKILPDGLRARETQSSNYFTRVIPAV
jgi:hypothetical protein